MCFDVSADAYGQFMGRYSEPLAALFADLAGIRPGQRALDVGCGPGALTAELVRRLGGDAVCAVDPSPPFAAAIGERCPGVDVRLAAAEQLPFSDGAFDAAMAQLVVHFMTSPVTGLAEMGRVTRPGGMVAACVWDHAGGRGPLATFWQAVRELDPRAAAAAAQAGAWADPPLVAVPPPEPAAARPGPPRRRRRHARLADGPPRGRRAAGRRDRGDRVPEAGPAAAHRGEDGLTRRRPCGTHPSNGAVKWKPSGGADPRRAEGRDT